MAEIVPFRGILYNVSKVSIEDVLAPPYDIITPEYREELYEKSPHNIVRIDFGKDQPEDSEKENRYTRAKRYLETWINDGVLLVSKRPSFYAYEMSYMVHERSKRLIGFLGLTKLEELGKGAIFPHECTYSKPKLDRLNILRYCNANISPIFSLYKSTDKKISALLEKISLSKPYVEAQDADGALHRLWQVEEKKDIGVIQKELQDKLIFIADGHHRYETALEFQKEMSSISTSTGRGKFDYVLMFFANMLDEGLTILPTHRLVKEIPANLDMMLSQHFEIEPIMDGFDIAKRISGREHAFGLFQKEGIFWNLLQYKENTASEVYPDTDTIDVVLLHELILNKILHSTNVGYEMDVQKALDKVRNGQFGAAFFLNPTKVGDVEKAALSSIRMPPKSTYFYPKLLTGVVINSFSVFDGSV
jgi:uncharacterized protein (DUF1015 family)